MSFLKKLSITQWIIISMIVGTLIGWLFPEFGQSLKLLSTIFLRMIKSVIVPLLFSTLVIGIAGHGDDMKKVGRLALRSIIYFEIVTTLALAVGLIAVNLVKPGAGVSLAAASATEAQEFTSNTPTLAGVLEHTVPQSFFEAAAKNEVLQIVF
ncbi:MAG TPA: cation:dicarboxylase symporter family transporter, partial [Gemmatimonadaceae bacterium]|nr:cation:dicarboxylase symporter family transporter [Gemmatimonadaceae bacterium]